MPHICFHTPGIDLRDLPRSDASPSSHDTFSVKGERRIFTPPALSYTIRPLVLTEEDKQRTQFDSDFVPTPRIHAKSDSVFQVPVDYTIL